MNDKRTASSRSTASIATRRSRVLRSLSLAATFLTPYSPLMSPPPPPSPVGSLAVLSPSSATAGPTPSSPRRRRHRAASYSTAGFSAQTTPARPVSLPEVADSDAAAVIAPGIDTVTACDEAKVIRLAKTSIGAGETATTSTCTTTRTITSSATNKAITTTTTTMVDPSASKISATKDIQSHAPSTSSATSSMYTSDSECSVPTPKTPDTPTPVHIRISPPSLMHTSTEKMPTTLPASVESFLSTSSTEPFPDVPQMPLADVSSIRGRVNELASESMQTTPAPLPTPLSIPSANNGARRIRQRANTYGSRPMSISSPKDIKLSIDTKRANENNLLAAAAAPFSPLASSPLRAATVLEPTDTEPAASKPTRRGRANTITRIVVSQASPNDNVVKSLPSHIMSSQTGNSSGDENDNDNSATGMALIDNEGNTKSTARSVEHYPSVGELLWHNPLMYSDVRLRFEDEGALAANCSLPTVLHLHSIVLLQARFFRDRLTNLDDMDGSAPAPGPGNPVDLLIRLPAHASKVQMNAFHLTIKLMYTKQFARELNSDLERAIGVLGVCNDIGFKEGVQSAWCWLAQRCIRDKRARLWERLCDAYPTIERKFRQTVDAPATRHLLARSNVPDIVAPTPITATTSLLPAWPDLKVGASVEFRNANTPDASAALRMTQRRGLFFGPMRNVAMSGELSGGDNSRESSPRIKPSRPNSLPDVLRLEPPILELAENSSATPSDAVEVEQKTELLTLTAPSSPVEQALPLMPQPIMNAIPLSTSSLPDASIAGIVTGSLGRNGSAGSGTRGRRRSSFNPPRPSAKVLAQCSEPNDPATTRRRVLIHWLAKFESRALDASVGHFPTSDNDMLGGSNSLSGSPINSRSSSPSRPTSHRRVASNSHPILIPPPVVEHPAEANTLLSTTMPSSSLLSAAANSITASPPRRRRTSTQSPAPHLLDTVRQLVESGEVASAEAIGYIIRIMEAVRLEQTSGPRPCMVLGSEAIDRSLAGIIKHGLAAPERTRLAQWLDISGQDEEMLFQPMAINTTSDSNTEGAFWFLRQTTDTIRSLSHEAERSSSESKELDAFRSVFESSN
ncbi:hypothetical protein BDF19DRAFT_426320 [Syncephalis fuscata]|nr:hypothetical protein BDF19DRAFT_426320 [Syncephalis fuscata]